MEQNIDTETQAFDVKRFLRQCLKSWKIFAACMLAFAILGYVYSKLRPSVYEVDATVMIPETSTGGNSMMIEMAKSFSFGDFLGGSSSADNEMVVMGSHNVYMRTVKELGLNTSYLVKTGIGRWTQAPLTAPVRLVSPEGIGDTLSVPILFDIKRVSDNKYDITVNALKKDILKKKSVALPVVLNTGYGSFTIEATPYEAACESGRTRVILTDYNSAAQTYAQLVQIFLEDKKIDIISLAFVTSDVNFGKLLLSTLIDNYIKLGIEQMNIRNIGTLEFVTERLNSLQSELEQSETKIKNFKERNNFTDINYASQAFVKQLSSIEENLLAAETESEIINLTRRFLADPENKYSMIPELGSVDGISSKSSIASYNQLVLQRMRLLESAKPDNLAVKKISEMIDALRANIIESIDQAYRKFQVRVDDIRREGMQLQSKVGDIPTLEMEYRNLKRVQSLKEQLYYFLLQQREESAMSIERAATNAIVLNEPYVIADKVGMGTKLTVLIFMLLGAAIAAAWVFFKKMRHGYFADVSEFSGRVSAPVLAEIGPEAPAEEMNMLRTDLLHRLGPDGKVVIVTSVSSGEGKDTMAAGLAASIARTGKRVLLLNADLRDPSLPGEYTGKPLEKILRTPAAFSQADAQIVGASDSASYSVVATASGGLDADALLSSEAMAGFIARMRDIYDMVIIDGAVIGTYSDTYQLAPLADATLIVVRTEHTTSVDIAKINSLYADGRFPRIALIVNKSC